MAMLEEQEKHLRTQVAIYTEKFEDFQDTLTKSHEAFQSYKVVNSSRKKRWSHNGNDRRPHREIQIDRTAAPSWRSDFQNPGERHHRWRSPGESHVVER